MKTNDTIRGNEEAERNIKGLLLLREKSGLSQRELSQLSGVGISSIQRYESGQAVPTLKNYNKLCKVFDWKKVLEPVPSQGRKLKKEKVSIISPLLPPRAVTIPQAVKYEFEEGHEYRISSTEDNYIFAYEGKLGIHHVFREMSGKWITTYTDAQLIGERVKEV